MELSLVEATVDREVYALLYFLRVLAANQNFICEKFCYKGVWHVASITMHVCESQRGKNFPTWLS